MAILGVLLQSGTALGSSMRGDANADGVLSVLDVFYVINTLFSGGEPSLRACLADANNDRDVTASDPIFLLNHLFGAGPAPLQIAESCNSEDDDCDGVVDNGFRNPLSGLYDQDFSCGSCAVNCGSSGQCIVTGGTPGCVASCDVAGNFDLNGNAVDGCEFTLDSSAIYVSTASPAIDDAACGLGPVGTGPGHYPCLTITQGIGRATAESRSRVNVAEGTYQEAILLESGVSLYGGFDNSTWARDPQNNLTQVMSLGNIPIQGTNVANLTIDGLTVQSSPATGTGESGYGIVLANAQQIQILNNTISSGSGAAGGSGTNGAAGADGGPGGHGNPGCEDSSFFGCTSCSIPARGTAGASSAGRPGGAGGLPGLGGSGGGPGGIGIIGTPGGAGASCGGSRNCDGQPGGTGAAGTNGNPGQGGAFFGSFFGTTYIAASGMSGTNGNHGNGGGGGGGGGGGENLCDSYGSSGGGGGGGGEGGGGGTGGSGGGGSFAIVLLDTTATVVGNQIITSTGGNGGAGGNGGLFSAGGVGGQGGFYGGDNEQDDGGDGARGGQAGRGGEGGDGGGGGGGPSIGIVLLGTSTVSSSSNSFEIGTGGVGGPSGSAPGATGHSAVSAIPQPPVQIDVSSTFNADLIVNDSAAGPVDAVNDPMDLSFNNNAFVTQAAAESLGCVSPAGLPNNGFFAANADHPNVQLAYSNDDDGVNAHHGATPAGLPFNVPEGTYTNVHLFFSSGFLPAVDVTVSLTYTTGLNEDINITVPDWFEEAVAPAYTLFNGGDRVDATPPQICDDSNTVAIFGFNIRADETRLLQRVTIRTGYPFLGFFGATGMILPGSLSLTKPNSAEQNP